MTAAARGRPVARALLVLFILAITIGPRLRLPDSLGRAVDLRLQDLLLILALLYVGMKLPFLRQIWGRWPLLFGAGAITVTILHLFANANMLAVRTVAYLGRPLETFVLAAVIAGLYQLSGNQAGRLSLHALHAAAAANGAWVTFQYATGEQRTLIGSGVGDLIEAYGPKLIGEASAFGTGFFFVFVAALGCAEFLTKVTPRWLALGLLTVGVAGAWVSQSRVSLGAAALCAVAAVLLPDRDGRHRVVTALTLGVVAFLAVPRVPQVGRLSEAGVEAGFGVRTTGIWEPLFDIVQQRPLLGIGAGQLGTYDYPWTEAHNVALRAALDFGIIVGACFLAAYLTIGWRSGRAVLDRATEPVERTWAALAMLLVIGVLFAGVVQDSLAAVMSTHLVMLAVGLLGGARLGPLPDPKRRRSQADVNVETALRLKAASQGGARP